MNVIIFILILAAHIVVEPETVTGRKYLTHKRERQYFIYFVLMRDMDGIRNFLHETDKKKDPELEKLEELFLKDDQLGEDDGNAITNAE